MELLLDAPMMLSFPMELFAELHWVIVMYDGFSLMRLLSS
jgi:hypothetical protein